MRNEVGYIMFGVGVFIAYISYLGVVGNLQDNVPLCSYPQPLPACSAGRWLVVAWASIGAGAVAMLIVGVYLALKRARPIEMKQPKQAVQPTRIARPLSEVGVYPK